MNMQQWWALCITDSCAISCLVSVIDPEDAAATGPGSPEVEAVLRAVPEFRDRYLALVEAADGDPGAAATLTELAEYLSSLLAEGGNRGPGTPDHRPVLVRCLVAVEAVVERAADGSPDDRDLIAGAFVDNLAPREIRLLEPWLGPHTRSLLTEIDPGPIGGR